MQTDNHQNKHLSKGYIQLYMGDGKGKTTAALGLALRASGHGFRTYIGQFMKKHPYGELGALDNNPHITIEQYGTGHYVRRGDIIPKEDIAKAQEGLERVRAAMLSGEYDIVVLDEVTISVWFGLLEVGEVLAFLDEKPECVEVILTGRRTPRELIARADLVTEMRAVKHYYTEQGLEARVGIER